MQHYVFREDVAIADLCFDASGKTLEELFTHCAEALLSAMVDVKSVKPMKERIITLENTDREMLLFDFLNEIVYAKDTYAEVFGTIRLTIVQRNGMYHLRAILAAAPINPETQKLGNDVKAVTFHQFGIAEKNGRFTARVIVDI